MLEGLLLTSIVFSPLLGGLLLLGWPSQSATLQRIWTAGTLCINFLLCLLLWLLYPDSRPITVGEGMMAFEFKRAWFTLHDSNIHFHLGVDGISILLILLTALIGLIVLLASWKQIQDKAAGFCFALLSFQTTVLGALMALDLFLFLVFLESSLIPIFFFIGLWGKQRRIHAATRFLIYALFGSAFLFLSVLYIGIEFGTHNLLQLYDERMTLQEQNWLFLGFAIAFLMKVPMFPFHTWFPDTQAEAPPSGSVLLTSLYLQVGAYGFLRMVMPLFPDALHQFNQPLMILAVFGIVYAALLSLIQHDLMKFLAFVSMSHFSYIMLGLLCLNPQGLQGGLLHIYNHSITLSALFLLAGILAQRHKSQQITELGGLSHSMPLFSSFFLLFSLAVIGLPGLNGFVSEFFILVGVFGRNQVYAVIAAAGAVLLAFAMLWTYQRMTLGTLRRSQMQGVLDLSPRECSFLAVLAIFTIGVGLYPSPFLSRSKPTVHALLRHIQKRGVGHRTLSQQSQDVRATSLRQKR